MVNNKSTKKTGVIDKYIGKKIKLKRIQYQFSQAHLGNLLGVTFQQIQKYENGSNRTPVSRLVEMTNIFNIPINYFVEG